MSEQTEEELATFTEGPLPQEIGDTRIDILVPNFGWSYILHNLTADMDIPVCGDGCCHDTVASYVLYEDVKWRYAAATLQP